MQANTPNPHETAARAIKVSALVCELDRQAKKAGFHPIGDAAAIVVMLSERWQDPQWARLAVCAGKHPPSAETKRQVIAVYLARREQPRFVVRYYDAQASRRGRGVQARQFADRAEAENFAIGKRLYSAPARVEEVRS